MGLVGRGRGWVGSCCSPHAPCLAAAARGWMDVSSIIVPGKKHLHTRIIFGPARHTAAEMSASAQPPGCRSVFGVPLTSLTDADRGGRTMVVPGRGSAGRRGRETGPLGLEGGCHWPESSQWQWQKNKRSGAGRDGDGFTTIWADWKEVGVSGRQAGVQCRFFSGSAH